MKGNQVLEGIQNLTPLHLETKRGTFALYRPKPNSGPKLLCLHGGPGLGARSIFPGLMPLADIFDLIFVDQRGSGQTPNPKDGDWSLKAYVEDVIAIREALDFSAYDQVGLYGFSFGGYVTLSALANHHQSFHFGIVSNTATSFRVSPKAFERMNELGITKEAMALEQQIQEGKGNDETLTALFHLYLPLYMPELSETERETHFSSWTLRLTPYKETHPKLVASLDLTGECKKIQVPVLAIGSSKDALFSRDRLDELTTLIPQSTQHYIKGAGHFSYLSNPKAYAKIISNWHS